LRFSCAHRCYSLRTSFDVPNLFQRSRFLYNGSTQVCKGLLFYNLVEKLLTQYKTEKCHLNTLVSKAPINLHLARIVICDFFVIFLHL
jgi:hypothetical protein